MKRLIFSILLIFNIASAEMSEEEIEQELQYCKDGNKTSCQYLIDNGNPQSIKECDKDTCAGIGLVYEIAGYITTAIEYYKRAISLGDEWGIVMFGGLYYDNKDYINAKKYLELGTKAKDKELRAWGFTGFGNLYQFGYGVRQDYKKAFENYKKSCDIGVGEYSGAGCSVVGAFYGDGLVVKQNLSLAKEYYGKGCDLGDQWSCEDYKELNERGIK